MQKLVEGIHHFQDRIFRPYQEFFARLATGQSPEALFITCSDSRIDPNLLTQTAPGELFIARNAGNIVPPYGAVHGGEAATIEYAVAVLKVRDLIVCGHSDCGAMKALVDPHGCSGLPAVAKWLEHAEATRRILATSYPELKRPEELLEAAVQENVLVQLEHLRTHPSVAAALARGELHLHAWIYQIDAGAVFAYDPAREQFEPLGTTRGLVRPPARGTKRLVS
ncbi:carbonic anhydrase [Nannocystis exedens]|uniref:Carbonic anhydrase n=1 Tax=Nannocystis exedens TaxID=54 RepID=A0A1I1UWJ5_9BACT|nr:carbonic anhydrase [Nannocystis exedens]PCC72150.1 carbonic anhydrase [Nannocystis exedens]SFD75157.1 carbonic anhydrase [Nannocystis exedens]